MRNSNRDRHPGGGNKFGRRDSGQRDFRGNRDRGHQTMHEAVCAECGDDCHVPFQPRDGQQVFCNKCFGKMVSRDQKPSGSGRDSRPNAADRRMFTATCDDCGKSCEVPFKPTPGKPVFCKACFGTKGGRNVQATSAAPAQPASDQFAVMNAKLDRIIKALEVVSSREQLSPKTLAKPAKKTKVRTITKKKSK
jgi:CxxC-x17-CxxC domain-containing protein